MIPWYRIARFLYRPHWKGYQMKSVELFAGAGGLAMGASLAGFKPLAVVEWNKWCCDTIRENQKRRFPIVSDWNLIEEDVRKFDWESLGEDVDLVTGGPPCQPFSMAGKHKAFNDDRDMFPAIVSVIRALRPKAFIIENVKGLMRSSFANYYQYILLQLEFPEIVSRRDEDWLNHLRRLQIEKTSKKPRQLGLTYNVVATLVNAADYGVPQKRERIFIVGFRSDIDANWSFPKPTHSKSSLLHSKWISGEYWRRHNIAKSNRPIAPDQLISQLQKMPKEKQELQARPWRTVRDALQGLTRPSLKNDCSFHNHLLQLGARVYTGHTGSPLDEPAKTLKAGDHGVPGGENMVVFPDGSVRYFSVRESARLQTFPDGFIFHGSWTETMRQLGNAVPITLARYVCASVGEALAESEIRCIKNTLSRSIA